jgi:hypothetical protein
VMSRRVAQNLWYVSSTHAVGHVQPNLSPSNERVNASW